MKPLYFIRSSNVSKTLFLFFLLLQFILSLDFGFVRRKSSKIRVAVRLLNVIQSLCLILFCLYYLFIDFSTFHAMSYVYFVTQYLIMVSIFFFHDKNNSFCSFLENLNYIDAEMKASSRFYQIDLKIIFTISFMLISKFCICACICLFYFPFSCHGGSTSGMLLFLCAFSINVPLLLYSFTFYASYCRLKTLRNLLQQYNCSYVHGAFIYKFIVDSTEIAKKVFDYVIIVALLFRIPEMLGIIFITIKHIKFALIDASEFTLVYVLVVFYIVVMLSPAIVANMLCNEAAKLRLLLHDMTLSDRGAENDIRIFIHYIEARPFKYLLLQVIPLNTKLPLILINISVTYLIVVLQLSHVY